MPQTSLCQWHKVKSKKSTEGYNHELQMDLSDNNLGENSKNIQYLGEGLRQLPNNLQYLKLGLGFNKLGENDIEALKIIISQVD